MELAGHIVTPGGIVPGRMTFGATVTAVERSAVVPDRYVLPGFIAVHVHGGGDTVKLAAGLLGRALLGSRVG